MFKKPWMLALVGALAGFFYGSSSSGVKMRAKLQKSKKFFDPATGQPIVNEPKR